MKALRALCALAASGWLLAACGERAALAPTAAPTAPGAAAGAAQRAAQSATASATTGATTGATTSATTGATTSAVAQAAAVAAAPAPVGASTDRLPPPAVAPVDRNGVRYSQAEDGRSVGMAQLGGVLVASDARSGQRLWTLAVYSNPIDAKLEADVQWLYFKSMAFDANGSLRIVNEAGHTYLVDVNTRRVSPVR